MRMICLMSKQSEGLLVVNCFQQGQNYPRSTVSMSTLVARGREHHAKWAQNCTGAGGVPTMIETVEGSSGADRWRNDRDRTKLYYVALLLEFLPPPAFHLLYVIEYK